MIPLMNPSNILFHKRVDIEYRILLHACPNKLDTLNIRQKKHPFYGEKSIRICGSCEVELDYSTVSLFL